MVLGACSGDGAAEFGPGVADGLPVGVLAVLVGQRVEQQQRQPAQLGQAQLGQRVRGGHALHDLGAHLQRHLADALVGDGVQQVTDGGDLVRGHRVGQHGLDLHVQVHVHGRPAHERGLHGIQRVDLDSGHERLAQRLQGLALDVVEHRCRRHWSPPQELVGSGRLPILCRVGCDGPLLERRAQPIGVETHDPQVAPGLLRLRGSAPRPGPPPPPRPGPPAPRSWRTARRGRCARPPTSARSPPGPRPGRGTGPASTARRG